MNEQENCKYCHSNSQGEIKCLIIEERYNDFGGDSLDVLHIRNNRIFMSFSDMSEFAMDNNLEDVEYQVNVNYCPMCGRKLGD